MFGSKKTKEIKVDPNPEYCVWKVEYDEPLAYDAVLNVAPGVEAMYIVNNSIIDRPSGRRCVINSKKEKRDKNKIEIIGVNRDKVYKLRCGVGNIPYHDNDLGLETVVGISVDCDIRIIDGWTLYKNFGNRNLTEKDVNNHLRSQLAAPMRTELAKKLQSYSYISINTQTDKMAELVEGAFAKTLPGFGIYLEPGRLAFGDPFFPEEYIKARAMKGMQTFNIEMEKEQWRHQSRMQRGDLESLRTVSEIAAAGEAAKASEQKSDSVKCRVCGLECNHGEKFCPKCGAKL